MTVKRKVEVRMANGDHVMVDLLERSFNPDVGADTIRCRLGDREFMAVRQLRAWREWTAADRVRALIEGLKMRRRAMSDMVTRLLVQVSALQSGFFLVGLALAPRAPLSSRI